MLEMRDGGKRNEECSQTGCMDACANERKSFESNVSHYVQESIDQGV